ncbi:MAG: dipeptide ABC transporter ATP-binding protein [Alkalilacustris sp.]
MTERTAEPILAIENLSISFFTRAGEIPAVMDFSCTVMPGEAMGLVGESGCGKSTVALGVMRDLGRSGRITGGRVRFRGRDIATMPEAELRRIRGAEIAMIYQEPMAALNPSMTVGAQLAEVPMIHRGIGRREAMARAARMLADVRLPDPERILASYPHQLSGGQQQRIVIAMALMAEPALLILDEPTTALDVTVEAGIVDLLRELGRKTGTAMLFISHNLGLVLETCDRITVMYSGEAVETGPVREVFGGMRHPYTQALLRAIPLPGADREARPLRAIPGNFPPPQARPQGCNFGPRCEHFRAGRCDVAEIAMLEAAPDHHSRCLRLREIDWDRPAATAEARPRAPLGAPVLQVAALRKDYAVPAALPWREGRVVTANAGVSLEARAGETLAIVGESGCGKSTLARVLMGLETATQGAITLDNKDIHATPVQKRDTETVSSLQMVFQNPFDTLNPSLRVGRQIQRTLEVFGIGRSDADRRARMLELLDLVKLPRDFADRLPRQLSGGQKQRVGIARAFAGTARVVVADEPVSALDVSVQAAVTELLCDIQARHGTTLLFISHDLGIVRYLADRVMVMYLGHVVETGPTERVFAPPYHPYTEALLSAVPVADPGFTKQRIVLEGDIPSAMNPPPGCPFQTRCRWKSRVPGGRCETDLPPLREVAPGHALRCHLPEAALAEMAPVIAPKSG